MPSYFNKRVLVVYVVVVVVVVDGFRRASRDSDTLSSVSLTEAFMLF